MGLDDYLQGLKKFEPEKEVVILNLHVILGSFIQAKQWLAATTIEAAINEVRNSMVPEITDNAPDTKEDEIPF